MSEAIRYAMRDEVSALSAGVISARRLAYRILDRLGVETTTLALLDTEELCEREVRLGGSIDVILDRDETGPPDLTESFSPDGLDWREMGMSEDKVIEDTILVYLYLVSQEGIKPNMKNLLVILENEIKRPLRGEDIVGMTAMAEEVIAAGVYDLTDVLWWFEDDCKDA